MWPSLWYIVIPPKSLNPLTLKYTLYTLYPDLPAPWPPPPLLTCPALPPPCPPPLLTCPALPPPSPPPALPCRSPDDPPATAGTLVRRGGPQRTVVRLNLDMARLQLVLAYEPEALPGQERGLLRERGGAALRSPVPLCLFRSQPVSPRPGVGGGSEEAPYALPAMASASIDSFHMQVSP